jgi:hypothetical protein
MISRRAFLSVAAVAPAAGVGRVADAAVADVPALSSIPVRKVGKLRLPSSLLAPSPMACRRQKKACGSSTRAKAVA